MRPLQGLKPLKKSLSDRISFLSKAQSRAEYPIKVLWRDLQDYGDASYTGPDEKLHPPFVNMQGAAYEDSLTQGLDDGSIEEAVIVIHTPKPATPLCSDGSLDPCLMSEDLQKDPVRLTTVKSRARIIRQFMQAGGKVITAYPENFEMESLSEEAREVFSRTKEEYPHMLEVVKLDFLPSNKVGASSWFLTRDGLEGFFSIQATQADRTKDEKTWKIWLGRVEHPNVQKREEEMYRFLEENGCDLGI